MRDEFLRYRQTGAGTLIHYRTIVLVCQESLRLGGKLWGLRDEASRDDGFRHARSKLNEPKNDIISLSTIHINQRRDS
jgi:hypothetical protein